MSDNIKKWVEVLRSGEYKQAAGQLRRAVGEVAGEYRYCCLGVACDLYTKETEDGGWADETFTWDDREEDGVLPPPVQAWLGLNDSSGEYIDRSDSPDGIYVSLVELNDTGSSFAEIADLIETNPEALIRAESETTPEDE